MSIKQDVETIEKAIVTFLSDLLPLNTNHSVYWSTPDTLTQLSFGVSHSGIGLFKYSCGDQTKEYDDGYPHYALCTISEWKKLDITVPQALERIALAVPLKVNQPSHIEEDSDEEYEWMDLMERLETDYQMMILVCAVTRVLDRWPFNVQRDSACQFDFYTDFDEETAFGKLNFSEYEEFQDDILEALAETPEELAFLRNVSFPGGSSTGDDSLPDFYRKAASEAKYDLVP
ncbi:hypothetical protein BTA51_14285 [Hahella sp. CCB-MM4]|uniref:hypothetical protein n=1 Tax=Hahella sp. (strain CCB-MM4) TaxID=1926491 RepID=UPI000B9C218B|nr:hypothetical protein [Hahella sp. CCB-MM4]OZG72693.1 hypothetical protein BTA51_14285 [Hahella sp. CCB-MM4]